MTAPVEVPRPEAGEYAPYYGRYIDLVADTSDAIRTLARQQDLVNHALAPLDDNQASQRYAAGKWSVKEVLGHMLDAERIFAYRLLRIARGDETPLAGFDENAYVPAGHFDARSLTDLLGEWRSVRAATIAMVRGLPEDAWTARGHASGQPVSARALLYIIVGHVDHHLNVLYTRYGVPTL